MRALLRRIAVGITALVVFRAVLQGLYAFVLPEWYIDAVLFDRHWGAVLAPLPVVIALTAAGVVLVLPTWLARRRGGARDASPVTGSGNRA